MNSKGFTLVELAVVSMIITLLSAILLARLHVTQSSRLLKSTTQELVANIRKTQSMAISTTETGGNIPCGYGLYFNKNNPSFYILFADWDLDPNCSNINRLYNGGGEEIKKIYFSSRIEIKQTQPDPFSLFFLPPDPETSINYPSGVSEAVITLQAKGEPEVKKEIRVNAAGKVEME